MVRQRNDVEYLNRVTIKVSKMKSWKGDVEHLNRESIKSLEWNSTWQRSTQHQRTSRTLLMLPYLCIHWFVVWCRCTACCFEPKCSKAVSKNWISIWFMVHLGALAKAHFHNYASIIWVHMEREDKSVSLKIYFFWVCTRLWRYNFVCVCVFEDIIMRSQEYKNYDNTGSISKET